MDPTLSIVIPCLNEAETLGRVIEEAWEGIRLTGCTGEVVVADNGSTDGSREIAIRHRAQPSKQRPCHGRIQERGPPPPEGAPASGTPGRCLRYQAGSEIGAPIPLPFIPLLHFLLPSCPSPHRSLIVRSGP
jgi:glycosyltransferase involved in cell wall biosynthesis